MDPQHGNGHERRLSLTTERQEIQQSGSTDIQYTKRSQEQSSDKYRDSQSFQELNKIPEINQRKIKPQNSKSSRPEAQIKFYSHFVEKAVANLKDDTDKVLAARWILFLERQPASPVIAEYLKQLLFVCLHGRLSGAFAKPPAENIQQLPQNQTIDWLTGQVSISHCEDQTPIHQEMSESRTQYLAMQDIPYFGTHIYFAISDDPIDKWEKAPAQSHLDKI